MIPRDPPPNCPRCGEPLTYRKTGIGSRQKGNVRQDNQEVHLYFCDRDGFYTLWPDGGVRYTPSSYRPTELTDFDHR